MDQRSKILTAAFGLLVVYGVFDQLVYPRWVEPMLTIDDRIAEREQQLEKLLAVEEEVRLGKEEFRELVTRIGSFDVGRVETSVRDRLDVLIEKHKLQDANTTPSRPRKDRKTGLAHFSLTVTATGTLEAAVGFLADVAELPQLSRVTNPAIYPASRVRNRRGPDLMNIRVPIEILVAPQLKLAGRIDEDELREVASWVRHRGRDYSTIWEGTPLSEPIVYKKLVANAGRDVTVSKPGRRTSLSASARGGDGEYTYSWSPAEALSDSKISNPKVDTEEPFTRTYTVTITDGRGKTASDSIKVLIKEPAVAKGKGKPKPKPPTGPPKDKPWKDSKYMQVVMTLLSSAGNDHVYELMIFNKRKRQTAYYTIGEEFNGGELLWVHPTGGLARRNDDYFLYPIGGWLDQEVTADAGVTEQFPELMEAADRIRENVKAAAEAKEKAEAEAAAKAKAESQKQPALDEKKQAVQSKGAVKPPGDGKDAKPGSDTKEAKGSGESGKEKPGARGDASDVAKDEAGEKPWERGRKSKDKVKVVKPNLKEGKEGG